MPIIRMMALTVCSSVGSRWLASKFRPIAASTALNASSTGNPAATIAPNARIRIRIVSGSDVNSARVMSFPKRSLMAWFAEASPNSATITLGFPAWAWSTAFMIGAIFESAFSASPLTSNWTSAEWPSTDTNPDVG
jgi:uncharacterized membrane protein AbrB (regulator of aidB expression)